MSGRRKSHHDPPYLSQQHALAHAVSPAPRAESVAAVAGAWRGWGGDCWRGDAAGDWMREGGLVNIKYKIGDHVWRAGFGSTDNYVTCPDCAGTKRLRVIMGDESVVSIACAGLLGPTTG